MYSRGKDVEGQAFFYLPELERVIREWVGAVYHHTKHAWAVRSAAAGRALLTGRDVRGRAAVQQALNGIAHRRRLHCVGDRLRCGQRPVAELTVVATGMQVGGRQLQPR